MNFQSVKARAAKGGYKRGVNVDNSVLESLYKAVGNNFKPARKHNIVYAVQIKQISKLGIKRVCIGIVAL